MLQKIGEIEICTDDFNATEWESKFVKLFQENGYTVIRETDYNSPHFIVAINTDTN